ncbi:MAG TPA: sodium-independent anion transporter, partial [Pyrinomonadaceae bacterium]|nr:sodium-independent anion transporter [Pyrinomonadaceae bacterium]
AIQVGILLAAFVFLQKMSTQTQVSLITENLTDDDESQTRDMSKVRIPAGVEVFEIYGSLFFGAVSQFKESIRVVAKKPSVLILRMRHVLTIDASGLHLLEEMAHEAREGRYALVFSAVSPGVFSAMQKSGLAEFIGNENFAPDIFKAVAIAERYLKNSEVHNETGN